MNVNPHRSKGDYAEEDLSLKRWSDKDRKDYYFKVGDSSDCGVDFLPSWGHRRFDGLTLNIWDNNNDVAICIDLTPEQVSTIVEGMSKWLVDGLDKEEK